MSLCSSEHRRPRDSHDLWRPQVWARHGRAWLDIEAQLSSDPQSSALHLAPSPDSSTGLTLLSHLSFASLPALGQGLYLC